ncbi:hypothetical protein KsCSTR_04660 [Candidatus Kuenenia stuttgartiensis]|uniref:Uncharacterized protein n=1 Tax=Kuenenia stuttgartiensis TaxID=174633 RepID=Q1Q0C3_KUEST|nr:hypothetical protein KsCSTR_04660 [Candidatus Kuenenia stuttgartiensis]CAJ72776.1 unknown protein [Candidatus Kuenenia stuttgartiensis]
MDCLHAGFGNDIALNFRKCGRLNISFFAKSSCINPCFGCIRLMFSDIAAIICDNDRNKRIIFSPWSRQGSLHNRRYHSSLLPQCY